jgi:cytochrome c oxidase cbb3-type subunit III
MLGSRLMALICALLGLGMTGILVAQHGNNAIPASVSQGAALFSSNCAACHGADGRGGEHAPDIATASDVQRLADENLIDITKNGITGTGMPGFDWLGQDKVLAIVAYLRTLQGKTSAVTLPGDPAHGEALFFGKAQCSECHMAHGRGGFIGADLSYIGADVSVASIREVILNPEATLPAQKRAVTVVTNTGQNFTGALRINDNFSISMQTMDGGFHYFPKSQLTRVDIGSRSLMPGDYRSRLSDAEINDLASYLIRTSTRDSNPADTQSTDDEDE